MSSYSRLAMLIGVLLLTVSAASSQQPDAARPDRKRQAERFARHFFKAIRIIRDEHANPVSELQIIRWGIRGLFSLVKEPLPEEIASGLSKLEKAPPLDRRKIVVDAHLRLGRRKKLEEEKDLAIALNANFRNLEPARNQKKESQFFTSEFVRNITCVGYLQGSVGIVVVSDPKTGYLKIKTPIFNGPAYKAGLRGGDLITHIRNDISNIGKPLPKPQIYSTKGMSAIDAERFLAGHPGTRVRLTVIPAGSALLKK